MEKSNTPFEITKEKSPSTNKETKSEREIECSQPDFLGRLVDVLRVVDGAHQPDVRTRHSIQPDLARRNYWEQRMTKEDTKKRLRKKLESKKESKEESNEESKEENISSNKNC